MASAFISAVATGKASEILGLGPRGEAKTISALIAQAEHAKYHEQAGFSLPVPWMGITDTFNSHKEKTHESLRKPFWQGAWRLEDGGHKAIFKTNKEAVVLSLFGIEDKGAIDRARRETCCSWIEEAAPTTEGAGVPELALDMGITSQRVPTHAKVSMITSNYPDKQYWLWKRFKPIEGRWGLNIHPTDPGRITFQIPKGDNAYISDEDRQLWRDRLKERPDLQARLLEGRPGAVQKGKAVAVLYLNGHSIGFNEAKHVSPKRIFPIKDEPLFFGQDGGHTPATVIGQPYQGFIRIYASLPIEHGGMKQQYEHNVKPWVKRYAPWVLKDPQGMVRGCYDPSLPDDERDSDSNPLDEIMEQLGGGIWEPGPVDWEARKELMFASFNRSVGGEAALQIDPIDAEPLKDALAGGWFYPTDRFGDVSGDKPKQPNHPAEDLGQGYCYVLYAMFPELRPHNRGSTRTESDFRIFN